MKSKSKNLMILLLLIVLTTVELIAYDAIACRNGPNYWGGAYPGHGQTPNYFRNPQRREDYVFLGVPDRSAQYYDGSHYGTHDWIADALSLQAYENGAMIAEVMANYIRRLGYPALAQHVGSGYSILIPPLLLGAGIGEVSRVGIILNQFFNKSVLY